MDRNPSPPLESENNGESDVIGSTVYSQRFVLKCLLSLLNETTNIDLSPTEDAQQNVENLDSDLDNRLCLLWDMTTDHEVANYLSSNNILEIISNVVKVTNKPRLTEILIGILANMICSESVVIDFKNNEMFRDIILNMFSCRDTQTLIETSRCLKLCLQKDIWSNEWEEKFIYLDLWDDFLFISKSTTNDSLMLHISECCDRLLENSKILTNFLDKNNCISDLIRIFNDCLENEEQFLKSCTYWFRCLQTLTTTEQSSIKLMNLWDELEKSIFGVLALVSKRLSDIEVDIEDYCILLACCLSMINWNSTKALEKKNCKTLLNEISVLLKKRKTDEDNSYFQLAEKQLDDFMENMKPD